MTRKLDVPATVLWIEPVAVPTIQGGNQRLFDKLSDAVQFIIEDLPPEARATAWIATGNGALSLAEIDAIYPVLPPRTA